MSGFVELERSKYPNDALDKFKVTTKFNLDNARAMMWLSQLAYETADQSKVQSILTAWTLTMREFISNDPKTGLPPDSACVVIAGGRGATFVTFAGSDPGKIQDWVTDFDAMPSATGLHAGFEKTVGTVWPEIETAIKKRPSKPCSLPGTAWAARWRFLQLRARRPNSEFSRRSFTPTAAREPVAPNSLTTIRRY
jgi:triacylglycerol lipase